MNDKTSMKLPPPAATMRFMPAVDATDKRPTLKLPRPPTFGGRPRENVLDWLQKVELFINAHRATEEESVSFAVQLLEEHAARWWRTMTRGGIDAPILSDWLEFRHKLLKQFVAPNIESHARAKLASLRQVKSAHEYTTRFQNTLVELPSMTEEEALERYISGLKPIVQTPVRLSRPTNLSEAIRNALDVDDCTTMSSRKYEETRGPPGVQVIEEEITAVESNARRAAVPKLTEEERKRCMEKRLCFRCRKPGHQSNKCPHFPARD